MKKGHILKLGAVFILFVFLFAFSAGPSSAEPKGKLVMFHAGSLSVPLKAMEKEFKAKYPKVEIVREASGSTKAARKISEKKRPCDIMASADYKVIDKLLIPRFADTNIRFATNQLVLCYTEKSRYADIVNAGNWYEILQRKGVVWGHSEPNLDPCGYRSLMVMQLAEKHYKIPGLYKKMLANRPKANVRPKAKELISLLKSGQMDYGWEYLSVAVQHGLKYVVLPDEINLGNYRHDDFYKQAVVKVTGKKPGTMMELRGKSVTYGITILRDAQNKEAAVAFLEYMLDPNGGLKILKNMGQPPFAPARVPTGDMKEKLPETLKKLVEVRN